MSDSGEAQLDGSPKFIHIEMHVVQLFEYVTEPSTSADK